MASVKDNTLELDGVIIKLNTTLEQNIKYLNQGATAVDNYNKKLSIVPSEFQKSLTDIKVKTDSVSASTKKLEQTERQLQQARLKDIQLAKQREQAFDKYDRQLEREQAKLQASENLYNKIQVEMNKLVATYQNLASRKERGATLTRVEAEQMGYLEKRIKTLDTSLKAVDATTGKYTRSVGNYAKSGFNPLSNSINQLTREMPAFTYSVQTGFMALSNNIPIFTDAIGNAVRQNKELIAQGQPTTSVLKQVFGALFSFQTLLGVGITLLTVYGKEIGIWAKEIFGANNALSELNKSQKEFNEAKFKGKKDAQSEILELQKYLSVVKDVKVSDEERNIALKQLRSQFPFYFKNLTDAQILAGNYAKSEEALTLALEKRKDVEKKTELNVVNKQRLLDINKELDALKEQEQLKEKSLKSAVRSNLSAQGLATISNELNKIQERKIELDKESFLITEAINKNDSAIFQLKKETIGLEYQDEKYRTKKIKDQKDLELSLEDYLASRFALSKAEIEREIEMYDAMYKDEEQTLDNRLFGYENFITSKIKLAELTYEEEKRLNELALKNNIESLNQEYNEYIKTEGVTSSQKIKAREELNNALSSFAKKNALDLELIEFKHSNNIVEITKNMFSDILKIREHYSKLGSLKDISEQELRDYQDYALRLNNITQSTTLKRLDEIAKKEKDAISTAQRSRLQLEIDGISEKLQATKTGSEAELKLKTELYNKTRELTQLEINDLKEKEKAQRDYLKLLSDTYQGFVDDFASESGFGGLVDIFSGGLEKFKGDAVATALVVSEAFQQAFNTISEASQRNFDAEYARLERQRDLSIEFAGDSTSAREEIERQYEERRKAIARRQAEANKKLAIFNAVINTAQAVTSALANYDYVSAILFGILGAAQVALISSQEIPQFWKGTENAPEGLAWTQEKGAEVITDKNGNVKTLGTDKGAQLTYLNKGDKVYKSHEDYINKQLSKNGISELGSYLKIENNQNNSVDLEPLKDEIRTLGSIIANKSEVTIVNNESGTRYYERINGQRKELVNSVLTMKSRTIK